MNRQHTALTTPVCALLSLMGLMSIASTTTAQSALPYAGHLEMDGTAAEEPVEMQFSYFDAAEDGTLCGAESLMVDPDVGDFSVVLLPHDTCFAADALFVEIGVREPGEVDYVTFAGRQRVYASPNADRSTPSKVFRAPDGVGFGVDDNGGRIDRLVGIPDLEGASNFGLVIRGPLNAQVTVDIAANNANDGFQVRVPTILGDGTVQPLVDRTAFKVEANGQTRTEALDTGALSGDFITSDADSGCIMMGEVQLCWGQYASTNAENVWTTVPFEDNFANSSYAVTCTPKATNNDNRFCTVRNATASSFQAKTFSPTGTSGVGGTWIAIGQKAP